MLAHLFLNYLLDLPNALNNISWNGYMQPLTGVTPQVLVKEQILDAVAHLDGGGAVHLQDRACSSCSSRWTRTRCGSRPGSS